MCHGNLDCLVLAVDVYGIACFVPIPDIGLFGEGESASRLSLSVHSVLVYHLAVAAAAAAYR